MSNALNLIVNGSIAREVMVIDVVRKKYIVNKNAKSIRKIHHVIVRLIKSSPMINYCVFQMDNGEKYVIMKLKSLRYIAIKIAPEVNGERYITKLKSVLNLLEKLSEHSSMKPKLKGDFSKQY